MKIDYPITLIVNGVTLERSTTPAKECTGCCFHWKYNARYLGDTAGRCLNTNPTNNPCMWEDGRFIWTEVK